MIHTKSQGILVDDMQVHSHSSNAVWLIRYFQRESASVQEKSLVGIENRREELYEFVRIVYGGRSKFWAHSRCLDRGRDDWCGGHFGPAWVEGRS